ncbi:MAG: AMP-binding protein, partial [Afipia sp.]|nr:AMP-binding protein [Afipia sp.]
MKAENPAPNFEQAPFREVEFAAPQAVISFVGSDQILRNSVPLGPYPKTTFDYVSLGSAAHPDRICIAERTLSSWRSLTYAEVEAEVDQLAQALLDNGIRRGFVIAALSPNSIAQALLQLAALSIGAIFAPISVGYGSGRKSYDLLRGILDLLKPALVYVSNDAIFGDGLTKAGYSARSVIVGEDGLRGLKKSVVRAD